MSITVRGLSRTAAAFGTALALAALPLTLAPDVASATPTPVPTAEAEAATDENAGSSASSGTDDDSSSAEADGGASAGADAASPEADATASGDSDSGGSTDEGSSDGDGNGFVDPACDPGSPAAAGKPCRTRAPVRASWTGQKSNNLRLTVGHTDGMPTSWVGHEFSAPKRDMVESPAQTESNSDDNGQPVPEAAPSGTYELAKDGYVVKADNPSQRVKFDFTSDPRWQIQSDGERLTATIYPEDGANEETDGGSNSGAGGTAGSDADSSGGRDSSNADANAPGNDEGASDGGDDGSSGSSSSANASGSRADSAARADGREDSEASSEGQSTSSASGRGDGGSRPGNTEAGGGSDGDERNGGGNADDRTTESPETGNGSGGGRDVIPGDTGDDWMPGGSGESPRPDYSDPVPRNPDTPSQEDDTDLITGGDKPAPRGNTQAGTSFGESIVSTIVSSWPVFVLAASGMAAVGFILFLVSRRSKQEQ